MLIAENVTTTSAAILKRRFWQRRSIASQCREQARQVYDEAVFEAKKEIPVRSLESQTRKTTYDRANELIRALGLTAFFQPTRHVALDPSRIGAG
jgi:hypothetical protein